MRKRIGALLLGLVLLMNGFSWEALAADGSGSLSEEAGDAPQSVEDIWINPMYQDVEDADSIRSALDGLQEESQEERAGAGSSLTFLSKAKAASSICRQMVERKSMVSVYVQAGNVNAKKLASTLFEQALAVGKGTAGDEGDYIRYHLGGYASSVMRYRYGTGKYMVTYVMRYYTTKQQERRVTAKVKSVLSSLGVKNKAAYGKIKAIYDYICRHVEYDRATLGDSTVGKYTAYNALMKGTAVCQGYASLFYRMAVDSGLRVRVMPGESRGVPHAWNIVRLKNRYYNLDSTWDAGMKKYVFFLKSNKEFPNHVRDSAYKSSAFNKTYPMSAVSYKKKAAAVINYNVYNIAKVKVSGIRTKKYTGKKRTQSPTVKLNGVTLKKGRDYTISYKNNVKVGTAAIIFKGKGDYFGTLTKKFKIIR